MWLKQHNYFISENLIIIFKKSEKLFIIYQKIIYIYINCVKKKSILTVLSTKERILWIASNSRIRWKLFNKLLFQLILETSDACFRSSSIFNKKTIKERTDTDSMILSPSFAVYKKYVYEKSNEKTKNKWYV